MYPNVCSSPFSVKLQLLDTASLQPATSRHCPAQLATLYLDLVTTSYVRRYFLGWESSSFASFVLEVTIRSETWDFDSWSHVGVSWKAVRLIHGDRFSKPHSNAAAFPPDISAAERDLVLVFSFF